MPSSYLMTNQLIAGGSTVGLMSTTWIMDTRQGQVDINEDTKKPGSRPKQENTKKMFNGNEQKHLKTREDTRVTVFETKTSG